MKKVLIGAAIGVVVSAGLLFGDRLIDGFVARFVRPYLLLQMGVFLFVMAVSFSLQAVANYRAGFTSCGWIFNSGGGLRVWRAENPAKFRRWFVAKVVWLIFTFGFSSLMIIAHYRGVGR